MIVFKIKKDLSYVVVPDLHTAEHTYEDFSLIEQAAFNGETNCPSCGKSIESKKVFYE